MTNILASLHVYALNSMVPNHKTVYVLQYVMLGLHFKQLASIGQHFKELIQDFEGSCPVRKNWLVVQDYIPLSPCLFITQLVHLVLQLSLTTVLAYVWTVAMKPLYSPYDEQNFDNKGSLRQPLLAW